MRGTERERNDRFSKMQTERCWSTFGPTAVIREPATDDRSGAKRTTSRRTGNSSSIDFEPSAVFGREKRYGGLGDRLYHARHYPSVSSRNEAPPLLYATLILGPADGLTPSTRKGSDYAKRAAAPASPSR